MPWAFWLKAVCCNRSGDKQIKYGSIKVVVSDHLEQCSSSTLMPHFDKLTLPVFLSIPPSKPVRFPFKGPTIAHSTLKHIRNCSVFGASSWPRHICWTLPCMGYIMKSLLFLFHKNKTLLLLESTFFKPYPHAIPEILT